MKHMNLVATLLTKRTHSAAALLKDITGGLRVAVDSRISEPGESMQMLRQAFRNCNLVELA